MTSVPHRHRLLCPDPQTFVRLYPTTSNAALMAVYGVSRSIIHRWARDLGVQKCAAYRSYVQAQNARKRRLSPEQRAHLSARALAQGRTVSEETKAKTRATKTANGTLSRRGPAAPNWKGGRPWTRFKDPAYLTWRTAVLERDAYTCQQCGRRCKKYEKGLAAHHIQPYASHPALRFDVDNGRTLCRQCHMQVHGRDISVQTVPCACGCGTQIASHDRYGRARRYVNGHASRLPRRS